MVWFLTIDAGAQVVLSLVGLFILYIPIHEMKHRLSFPFEMNVAVVVIYLFMNVGVNVCKFVEYNVGRGTLTPLTPTVSFLEYYLFPMQPLVAYCIAYLTLDRVFVVHMPAAYKVHFKKPLAMFSVLFCVFIYMANVSLPFAIDRFLDVSMVPLDTPLIFVRGQVEYPFVAAEKLLFQFSTLICIIAHYTLCRDVEKLQPRQTNHTKSLRVLIKIVLADITLSGLPTIVVMNLLTQLDPWHTYSSIKSFLFCAEAIIICMLFSQSLGQQWLDLSPKKAVPKQTPTFVTSSTANNPWK